MIDYNLQFFAEDDNHDTNVNDNNSNTDDTNSNNASDGTGNNGNTELNIEALAGIISEQDKRIQQLEQDNNNLKKTNAQLLVRVSAGGSTTQQKGFDENLLDMVGFKPRKE